MYRVRAVEREKSNLFFPIHFLQDRPNYHLIWGEDFNLRVLTEIWKKAAGHTFQHFVRDETSTPLEMIKCMKTKWPSQL